MSTDTRRRTAGAFDIRFVIAALFLVYGIVLTIMGAAVNGVQIAKSAGINIDLLTGIAMIIFALLFIGWARLRPIVVTEPSGGEPSSEG